MRPAVVVLAAAAVCLLPTAADAQMSSLADLDREFVRLVERTAPAVVRVEPGVSGVCVSSQGLVLTDPLVAGTLDGEDKETLTVTFADERSYPARLLGVDAAAGAALLRIDTRSRLPAVEIGDPGALAVGHFLLTIGNAFGMAKQGAPTVTLGVVAALHRDRSGRVVTLETTAATNPGQNGGPYFDLSGRLVGLARKLPQGPDLALVTPIDVVVTPFRSLAPRALQATQRSSFPHGRSKARVLQEAFHLAAVRARPAVCTLLPTSPPRDATTASEEDDGGDGERAQAPREASAAPASVTGLIVRPRGVVCAPLFAFRSVDEGRCVLFDGREYRATVIARDGKAGLAFLVLDRDPQEAPLPTIPRLPQEQTRVGQFAIAVGAPTPPAEGSDPFVTVGIVSARHRMNAYLDALLTDAAINDKNAAGALVDLRGRLLGILLPPTQAFGQNSGLGLALPVDRLDRLLVDRERGIDAEPPFFGASLSDAPGGGVLVSSVIADKPADRAGIVAGDVIVALDGVAVGDRRAFTDYLWREKSAGDRMDVEVLRQGRRVVLEVRLAARGE